MEEPKKIMFNLSDFVSIMLQYYSFLDEYAKKVKEEKIENKIFIKEENEKFTEIDYLSQKLLVNVIHKFYPYKNIIIIGEESLNEENDKKIVDLTNEDKSLFLSSIEKISLKGEFKIPRDFDKTIDITNSEISIFVDPIDGTKSLIRKYYNPVTSLFGLCINNEPYMGFIHFVFAKENKTYFNFPSQGIFEFSPKEHMFLRQCIQTKENEYNFLISSTRSTEEMINFIKTFPNSKYENESGLGAKSIKCILEDKIYFTTGKNSLGIWDICATSCLLRELKTDIYCFNGEKVKFVPKKILFEHNGVICVNQNKLNTFLEHVKKYYSQNI
jgi:3'(2'), 5'-bisphosphate nucleotidase